MALSIDIKSFSSDGPSVKVFKRDWWNASQAEMPEAIASVIKAIQESQTYLDAQRSICTRLYGNSPIYGVNGLSSAKLPALQPAIKDRITFNVCQSVVDTKTAKMTKNKPRPLFLTDRGNYKQRRRAQKLNQFVEGVFFANRISELAPMAYRDGEIVGSGVVHVFARNSQTVYERVMAGEILVDEQEAMYGDPRQMHRVKNVDRRVLAAMFPGKTRIINDTNEAMDPSAAARPHVSDQITVAESWHLPSGPEAKDGIHSIICDGGLLFVEPWEKEFFPFAFIHSKRRQYGFWGQSAVERLQNIQLEVNKLLWVIQRTMHLCGSSKIWVEQGSKVVKEHLNNDIWSIGTYTGQPPIYITPPMVQTEVYQHLVTLIQRAYEQEGVSMLSAASRKPEGLDSGKAIREYNDIESERFVPEGKGYEQFHLDLARLTVETARDIYKKDKKVKAKYAGSKFIETIEWKDVDLDDDKYVIQCFPVSSLPNEPSGRLATIQEYIQAGFIDQRQGRRLMDFPDLDQVEGLSNAQEERILSYLDKIVDEGIFTPPDEYMDPMLARELSLQYINEYMVQNLEEEKLQMLRDFNAQLEMIQAAATPPPAPGMVPGDPAAPPLPMPPMQ